MDNDERIEQIRRAMKRKSTEELTKILEEQDLSSWMPEALEVAREELRKRKSAEEQTASLEQSREVNTMNAVCYSCGAAVPAVPSHIAHGEYWCQEHIESARTGPDPAMSGTRRAIKPLSGSAPSSESASSLQFPIEVGIGVGLTGILLIVFAAVRWNSIGSQIAREIGVSDSGTVIMFFAGGIIAAAGVVMALVFARPNSPAGVAAPEPRVSEASNVQTEATFVSRTEQRLRQLDDLRAKGLMSDEQYEAKKAAIIAEL